MSACLGVEDALRLVAPWIISLEGLLVIAVGVAAAEAGSLPGARGADFGLLVGGIGLALVGVLMTLRVRPDLARTALAGITAGYFAIQLSVFEAGTRRCDINETAPDCVGQVVDPIPYAVFNQPIVLGVLLLIFLLVEPFLRPAPTTVRWC